jgi:hypothetical protein
VNWLLSLAFSITYGCIEAVVIDGKFNPGDWNSLFGKFSKSYHVPMALLFLLTAIGFGTPELIPGMILVEDMSYFYFTKKDKLTGRSWVTGSYGWQIWFGRVVPNIYIATAILQGLVLGVYYALK